MLFPEAPSEGSITKTAVALSCPGPVTNNFEVLLQPEISPSADRVATASFTAYAP
jgi:hypothetical protein